MHTTSVSDHNQGAIRSEVTLAHGCSKVRAQTTFCPGMAGLPTGPKQLFEEVYPDASLPSKSSAVCARARRRDTGSRRERVKLA
jgi:hypothetical protein